MSNNTSSAIASKAVPVELFLIFNPLTTCEWIVTWTILAPLSVLYALVLAVIVKNDDRAYDSPYYCLICGVAFCDAAMLLYTTYTMAVDMIRSRFFGDSIDSFLGFALYWSLGWYGTQLWHVGVAADRFAAVVLHRNRSIQFGRTFCRVLYVGVPALGAAMAMSVFVAVGFRYTSAFKIPIWLEVSDLVVTFKKFDAYFSYILAGLLCCTHTTIAAVVAYKLHAVTNLNASYRREIKMFCQGAILAVLLCLVNFIHWMSPSGNVNRICNSIYVALNPVVYMCLDPSLAEKVFHLLKVSLWAPIKNCKQNKVTKHTNNNNVKNIL